MEREKVRKVRDRQQQRGRVRQMGASVDMGRGRHAQTRHGREYDWSKQHNRRVQTDRRRDAGGDDEHERQQPPRAVLGAARHERAECIEQPLAPATVADQEERGKEPDRRGQIAERLTRAIDADGAGGYEDHGCHYRSHCFRKPRWPRNRDGKRDPKPDQRQDQRQVEGHSLSLPLVGAHGLHLLDMFSKRAPNVGQRVLLHHLLPLVSGLRGPGEPVLEDVGRPFARQ